MNSIIKFGVAALAAGTFFGSTVPAKADAYASEFSNNFTKHGLPVPGAYFKAKENQQQAMSKSGKRVGEENQTTSKVGKRQGQKTAHFSGYVRHSYRQRRDIRDAS
jgi:hypothetical protein